MADKKLYSVRLNPELLTQVKDRADDERETVTAIFEKALKSFLSAPKAEPGSYVDKGEIAELRSRVERLEGIIDRSRVPTGEIPQSKPQKPDPITPELSDPNEYPDLITKKEASAITRYSVNTLNRTFSQNDILEVDKRGKAGLYRKSEVLERIGIKG